MTAAKKILNETKVRLKHGNLMMLIGAFLVLLMPILLVFILFDVSRIFMLGVSNSLTFDEIASYVCGALAIVTGVFSLPLFLGFKKLAYECSKGTKCVFSDLFYYYGSFYLAMRSIILCLRLAFKFFVSAVVLFILIFTLDYAVGVFRTDFQNSPLAILLISVETTVVILILVLFIDFIFRYFLASYLAIENEYESTSFCIKSSVKIMKAFRLEIFRLFCSLLHLFLLSLLVVPLLYTVPKITAVFSVSAKWMIASQNITTSQYDSSEI